MENTWNNLGEKLGVFYNYISMLFNVHGGIIAEKILSQETKCHRREKNALQLSYWDCWLQNLFINSRKAWQLVNYSH